MSVNRNEKPICKEITILDLPIAQKHELNKGIPLYVVTGGVEPIAKIDVVFNAGLSKQLQKADAIFTASMLSEGTTKRTGKQLSEALDFYGSYFQVKCNADDSIATLYCLTKHIENCLPLFFEALFLSVMPQKEMEVILSNAIQKLRINEKKSNFLARKYFYEKLFGNKHPYAVNYNEDDINNLNRDVLISFFEKNYKNGLKYIFASGLINDKTINQIIEEFKQWHFNTDYTKTENKVISESGKFFFEKKESLQSSIKIGTIFINRKDEDYIKLQIFNMLFGGYFGSRLMKNIREEKGLTYGIYSVCESFFQTGTWYISTEINNDLRNEGLDAIYKEISEVKKLGFSNEEIVSGKQYFLGSMLRGIDGVFSIAERNKIIIDYGLCNNYYNTLVTTIKNINNQSLIDVANKHIPENLVEVVVGA